MSGADGRFTVEGLPAGEYLVAALAALRAAATETTGRIPTISIR
jgi:hypothetical protein